MREGWRREIIKDVVILKSGKTVSKDIEKDIGDVIYTKVGDMNLAGNEINIISSSRYVNFEDINVSQVIPEGSIIFPKRGGAIATNKKRRIVKPTIVDLNTMALIPSEDIISDYLYFWFKTVDLNELSNGANVPQINNYSFDNTFINFPKSIEEQKQIVAILDDAFAAIEQAQANIEKNIDNAKELFQSKLNDIFSQKGEGWEEKSLGEACIVERGSSPRPIKKYITESEDGVNWIKIGDVAENAKFVTHTKQKITKEGAEKSRYVGKGDFILSNSMSFGRPYIMKIDGYIHDGWFVLRLPEDIHSDYFWQLLSSSFVKNQINQLAAGAIVKNISGDLVKKVNLSIPPIEAQKTIASQCDSLSLVIKSVISTYETKLTNLEDLKQSLLEQAFAGKLTDKDMPA